MNTKIPRFFMGTSTENGFCGFPRDLFDPDPAARAFLIKSGPGTGKSTLLRALATAFRENGETVEEFACSSDPASLDGIGIPSRRVFVFDATAPHTIEPTAWGYKEEIVSFGDALDTAALAAQREDIEAAAAENAAAHARARRILGGATALFVDRLTLATRALNEEKLKKIVVRLMKTELSAATHPVPFCGEQRRFLSAVTPQGLLAYPETPALLCPRLIALDDPFCAAAQAVLQELRIAAAQCDLPRIVCPHPLLPDRIAHLLLPSAGVGFVTRDRTFSAVCPARTLHLRRVYDEAVLRANKNRTAFDKKGEQELLSAATDALADAKNAHDLLEIPYKSAMNFKKLETTKTALYQRILAVSDRA